MQDRVDTAIGAGAVTSEEQAHSQAEVSYHTADDKQGPAEEQPLEWRHLEGSLMNRIGRFTRRKG